MASLIREYQRECWQKYKQELKLSKKYVYLYGNPIKVHVPVETATRGIMIVGAYPTAHFHTIEGIPDLPVADHLYPFSSERYFDGSRVRPVNSGAELETHYLTPLGYPRDKYWITDLVKVFLFKEGHIERYRKLGQCDLKANRNDFKKYAKASLSFLCREIELAHPKAVLLLGLEVISAVLGCTEPKARTFISPNHIVQDTPVPGIFFALPHPGIVMRNPERGKYWKDKLKKELIPVIKKYLSEHSEL